MPRKHYMTWEAPARRWRKMYRGKIYTVSARELNCLPTKEDSWQAANLWWRSTLANLYAPVKELLSRRKELLDKRLQAAGEIAGIDASVSLHQSAIALLEAGDFEPQALALVQQAKQVEKMLAYMPDPEKSVGKQSETFNALQHSRGIVFRAAQRNKHLLTPFIKWIGLDTDCEKIDANRIEEFYVWTGAQGWKPEQRKRVFGQMKSFVKYLAGKGLCQEPRNLSAGVFRFNVTASPIKRLTVDQVQTVLAAASGQTRLHCLLMLNCGMLGKDIADLQDSEVNWTEGTITRKRSKHAGKAHAPTVTYRLWSETLALLKQYRSGGATVLLTHTGNRWVSDTSNIIGSNMQELFERAGVAGCARQFRNTSCSLLGTHAQFKFYGDYFLANTPKGITERHYMQPSQTEFFAALDWLREQYGL